MPSHRIRRVISCTRLIVAWMALAAVVVVYSAAACKSPKKSRTEKTTTDEAAKVRPAARRARVTVRGTVSAAGQGIAGATVLVAEHSLDEGALGRPGQTPRPLTARTDDDGTWSIAAVPSGTYRVPHGGRA